MKKYLFIIIMFNFSCNTKKVNNPKNELPSITPTYMQINDIWALESMHKISFDTRKNIKRPYIEIHVKEKKLYGNDSCNEIFGKVETLDETALKISNIGGTKKGCLDMETPRQFRAALEATSQYKIANLKLHLLNAKGNEILTFRKVD